MGVGGHCEPSVIEAIVRDKRLLALLHKFGCRMLRLHLVAEALKPMDIGLAAKPCQLPLA
jgi:hypothetical protein